MKQMKAFLLVKAPPYLETGQDAVESDSLVSLGLLWINIAKKPSTKSANFWLLIQHTFASHSNCLQLPQTQNIGISAFSFLHTDSYKHNHNLDLTRCIRISVKCTTVHILKLFTQAEQYSVSY